MDSTAPTLDWPVYCLPRVLGAGRFTQEARGFAENFRHPDPSLHLFSYSCRMRVGGAEFAVQAGDVVLTPGGADQTYDIPVPGVHWCLRLRPPAQPRGPRLSLPLHQRLVVADASACRDRIMQIIDDFQRSARVVEHPAAWAAGAGAQALLCWLAARRLPAPAGEGAEACVARAEQILGNTECTGLSIAEVARRAGMSQNRLALAFLGRHGCTMTQFRAQRMIAHAQWMMESTDLALAEIRRRVGIQDPHHFNKLFRRIVGTSPSAWRAGRPTLMNSAPRPVIPPERLRRRG